MIRRRSILTGIGVIAISGQLPAWAQPRGKTWRIGVLENRPASQNVPNMDAFKSGMSKLGYIEGQHYVLEYLSVDGRPGQFPEMAAELIRRKIDLFLTRGSPATLAAMKSSGVIPVVTAAVGDPYIFVSSLARPGGIMTGLTSITTELQAKRLEILKELVPGTAKLGIMLNLSNPTQTGEWKEIQVAAKTLRMEPHLLDIRKLEDIPLAYELALRQRVSALAIGQEGLIQANGKLIASLSAKYRLPTIYSSKEYVQDGGLISYGVNYPDLYFRAATFVDKIFKGTKPGDIPIERPMRFEVMINLPVARSLGIKVPPTVMVRADKVIE